MVEHTPLAASVYRVFRLDVDGRIVQSEVLAAADDIEALHCAQSKIDSLPVELWDRDRLIARLEPAKS
jgi:hypothetical protein